MIESTYLHQQRTFASDFVVAIKLKAELMVDTVTILLQKSTYREIEMGIPRQ